MARISPEGYYRFAQTDRFQITYGGAEANALISLANFGAETVYVTKLPENDMAEAALRQLKAHGVDVSHVVRGGERMGLYFCERGAAQRSSKVIYDRKYAAVAAAKPSEYDWEAAFEGVNWFHWTGITPALSDDCAAALLDACRTAKAHGVTISCDLNFRSNLWSAEKAGKVMTQLMEYVDVCIANEEHCGLLFGVKPDADVTDREEGYKQVARKLSLQFNIPTVVITVRSGKNSSDNSVSAMLYKDNEYFTSRTYDVHIVERIGGGDALAGGLIYALQNGWCRRDVIEFAVAAEALKHSVEGDYNEVSVAEVQTLASGAGAGRVQR